MPSKLPVECILHGILAQNLSGFNKIFKKLELMMIDFAGLSLSGKILALWDNGHVSSQVLFWIF